MRHWAVFTLVFVLSGCASTSTSGRGHITGTVNRAGVEKQVGSAAEQLNFMMPKGWRIAYQAQHAGQGILEIVPAGETVRSWTRMITVQTFPDPQKYRAGPFIDGMGQLAKRVCVKTRLVPVITARQNGYKFSQKVLSCVRNRVPNIKETTDIKAIKGKQSFYVVQVAWKGNIAVREMRYWGYYMRDVTVSGR